MISGQGSEVTKDMYVVCSCTHMTSFSILMEVADSEVSLLIDLYDVHLIYTNFSFFFFNFEFKNTIQMALNLSLYGDQ